MEQVTQERDVKHQTEEEGRAAMTHQRAAFGVRSVDQIVRVHERLAKISPKLDTTRVVKLNAVASDTLSQPHNAAR